MKRIMIHKRFKKMKIFMIFVLLVCHYNGLVEAKLSNPEKREIIDQLALPFPEGKVFYRWQTEEENKKFLEAGEMTVEIYEKFMNTDFIQKLMRQQAYGAIKAKELPGAGPGMYIAENIHSAHMTGQVLVQMRLLEPLKYIDKTDPKFWKELYRKGLSWRDVESLAGSHIVFKYTEEWLVVRGRRGVWFEPFSFEKVTLNELKKAYETAQHAKDEEFKNAIEEEFTGRAWRDVTVINHSLMKALDTKTADGILDHHKKSGNNIQSATEGANLLKYLGERLSSEERERILSQAMSLAYTVDEKIYLLNQAEEYLSETAKHKLIQEIVPGIETAHQIVQFYLRHRRHLLTSDMEQIIADKMGSLTITNYSDGQALYRRSYWIKGFSNGDRQKILDQTIFHIEDAFEGALFLKHFEDQLSANDRKKIINKILVYVDSFSEGQELLILERAFVHDFTPTVGHIFSVEETRSIARQSVSHYETIDESLTFFNYNKSWHRNLSPEASEEIVSALLSPIQTSEQGIDFLTGLGRDWYSNQFLPDHQRLFLPEHRRLIINKILSCTETVEEGLKLISVLNSLWEKNYEDNKQERIFLTDIELIISRIPAVIKTAEEGAKFLSGLKGIFLYEALYNFRTQVVDHILSLIKNSEEGAKILKLWNDIFLPRERRKIVESQILPDIPSAERGMELLRSNEGVFSETEKYQMANNLAGTGKELALFREFLSDESYRSIKRARLKKRLKCLKAWSSRLLTRQQK